MCIGNGEIICNFIMELCIIMKSPWKINFVKIFSLLFPGMLQSAWSTASSTGRLTSGLLEWPCMSSSRTVIPHAALCRWVASRFVPVSKTLSQCFSTAESQELFEWVTECAVKETTTNVILRFLSDARLWKMCVGTVDTSVRRSLSKECLRKTCFDSVFAVMRCCQDICVSVNILTVFFVSCCVIKSHSPQKSNLSCPVLVARAVYYLIINKEQKKLSMQLRSYVVN